jgi:hypothetical protein
MTEKKQSIPQKVFPQSPLRTPTQTITVVALVVFVAIIIGALYLAQATMTATTGRELEDLAATRDYLQRANEDTTSQIAIQRNIGQLRGRAQTLGFVPVDSDRIEYVVVNGYSPVRATPTPVMTPQPAYVYDETFNGWVQKEWDTLVKQFEAWMGNNAPATQP